MVRGRKGLPLMNLWTDSMKYVLFPLPTITAGSGDVLSGMIASFLGQRYDTVESVLGAVMLHGYAGKERVAGLTASEIASIAVEPLETYRRTNARPYW